MQKVTVKDIKVKEGIVKSGQNEGKPWKLIILIGDDGSEFTTFDTGAAEVGVGGIIELEPVIKAGKTNFTEFKIIQKGPISSLPNGNGGMTPEMWAEKDRLEQFSRECNTCFTGIVELVKAKGVITPELKQVYDAALDWAMAHFKPPIQMTKPEVKTEKKETPVVTPPPVSGEFANPGEFLTACRDNLGLNKSDVLEVMSISDISELGDLNKAYPKVAEKVNKPPFEGV